MNDDTSMTDNMTAYLETSINKLNEQPTTKTKNPSGNTTKLSPEQQQVPTYVQPVKMTFDVHPRVRAELKQLATQLDMNRDPNNPKITMQSLATEAFDNILKKHNRPSISELIT